MIALALLIDSFYEVCKRHVIIQEIVSRGEIGGGRFWISSGGYKHVTDAGY